METNTKQDYSWSYTARVYDEVVKQSYTTYDENGVMVVFSVESEPKRKVEITFD